MPLADTAQFYEAARLCVATRELVDHPLARRHAASINRFLRQLSRETAGTAWEGVTERVKRIRWIVHANPLPPSHPLLGLEAEAAVLADHASQAAASYPSADLVPAAQAVIALTRELAALQPAPVGDAALSILQTGDLNHSALLACRPAIAQQAGTWLAEQGIALQVVTPAALSRMQPIESIVAIGPSSWYPTHLLTAPRAELLSFVHYAWIQDRPPPASTLPAATSNAVARAIRQPPARVPLAAPADPGGMSDLSSDEIEPTIDWNALAQAPGSQPAEPSEPEPDEPGVPAYPFLLAGSLVAWIEAADGARVDAFDPDAGAPERLRRELVTRVRPGDYLLFRTLRGGADLVHELADQYLGASAATLRNQQSQWKQRLQGRIAVLGIRRVTRDLDTAGAAGVSASNVRYWASPESIRTQHPRDFQVLMSYLGLAGVAEALWQAMGRLSNAHLRAGQQIRQLLDEHVLRANLQALTHRGCVDIELDGVDGGALSVLRVEARGPGATVPAAWLRVPRTLREVDLWLG